MNSEPIPSYAVPLLYGMGVLFIGLGIPLIRRRIKPNWLYGVRFPATFKDESVWYDMNALGGKYLVVIGVAYLILLTSAVIFGEAWKPEVRFGVPVGFLVVTLVGSTIFLAIASSRLLKQRQARQ